jgi:PAS domain S-box-containing protein
MLSELVQHSPDFIGVANMNLDVIFVNPAGQQLVGIEDDNEVRGTYTLDFFAEEDRERVRDELIPRLIADGSLRTEVPARNLKTGKTFPALWTSFVIRDPRSGEPVLLAAVTRDISSRKRDEDELRRRAAFLAEAQSISHTGSWSWNVTTGSGEWSDELFRILGLDPEVVTPSDSNYLECLVPEDREGAQRVWSEAVEGMLGFEHEHRIVRPNGAIRHVRVGGRRFQSGSGDLEFIGTLIDTTDQWNARFELESALAANTTLLAEVRALEQHPSRENISLKEQNLLLKREFNRDTMFKEIIGSSSALEETLARVARVATTDSTVLITGETGTGKELIAHAIHQASPRADKPFITFNCAAVVPSLIGSELFGHEKGAFTGADQRRIGRFELAEGGTLFLDEVGDIPAETQIMLLRVLQEREFERVGGNSRIRSDVRVLAATNRDLNAAIRENRFRSDLFYRLSVFPIEVPPLRDRKEDIPTLVSYFVQKYSRKLDKKIPDIDKLTMERLQAYNWPGNIRELQNLIERSVIISDGGVLVVDDGMLTGSDQRPRYGTYEEEMDNHERRIIEDALEKTRGRVAGQSGAAAILGIPQSTLATRISALKIDKHKFSSE